MKFRLLSLFALVLAPLLPAAAPALATPEPSESHGPALFSRGTKLVYKLSNGGTLLIAIEQFPGRAGPVKFRYLFSDLGPSGIITMTKEALASATALHNYFESGEHTLTDRTSVWLSQKVFADAKAGKPVTLDLGQDGKVTFKLDPAGGGFTPLSIDYGRPTDGSTDIGSIGTILLRSEDGEKTIRVKDDEAAPIIVDMDTGSFRVQLSLHL